MKRFLSSKLVLSLAALVMIVAAVAVPLFISASSMTKATSPAIKLSVASGSQTNWPQFGFVPQGGRYNPYENQISVSNVSQLTVAWTAQLNGLVYTSPSVSNGIVYAGTYPGGYFYALNASTGAILWQQHASGATVASPAVANGLVYVGAKETGTLYAFSAKTGQQHFVVMNPGGCAFDHDATTVADGVIYQPDCHGKLFAINATTGTVLWTKYSIGFDSGPAVANGLVYVGSDDGKLYVFDARTGNLKWTASTGGPISSSPAVANGLVYANSQDGYIYAFFAHGCGRRQCFPVWKGSTGTSENRTYVSSPAVANGRVYIGSATQNKLLAFNAFGCGKITCSPVWSATTQGIILASPAVTNGVVFATAWDGFIYAFNAQTGQELWSYNLHGGNIESSPVVVNGMVYVGATWANTLYAFRMSSITERTIVILRGLRGSGQQPLVY